MNKITKAMEAWKAVATRATEARAKAREAEAEAKTWEEWGVWEAEAAAMEAEAEARAMEALEAAKGS